MSKRQSDFSGLKNADDLNSDDLLRLDGYLQSRLPNFEGINSIKQFKGGQSNPTFLIKSVNKNYVLRRKPPGNLLKSAHAVDREYKIIKALKKVHFPVPETHILCTDESVIGTIFYVMEFLQGRIFWDADMPDCTIKERSEIYDDLNKNLAVLHNLDYESLGLSDFGVPGNYFARQISRWSKQYRYSETKKIKEMDKLIEWLPQNIPDNDESSILLAAFNCGPIIKPKSDAVGVESFLELSNIFDIFLFSLFFISSNPFLTNNRLYSISSTTSHTVPRATKSR